jgi:two-component system, LytTR family, sensor kinase
VTSARISGRGKRTVVACCLVAAVLIAASQWYVYDATHGHPERFTYYLVTCLYLCGVLAPAVLWLGRRWYIDGRTWKRSLPIHIACSLVLTGFGVFIEASAGWLPHTGKWAYPAALRHYFTQHTQISVLTYWALLAGLQIYSVFDQARRREVRAAQLEAQLREAQLTALCSQLQPHFLFNTLHAATTSIYDDPQGAEEILLSLSELLRLSLQALDRQEIPLRDEIEFLKHYAAIQQRRFGDRLSFDFQIEDNCLPYAVPPLVLQPLIENAIQHGVGVRKQPDVVTVRASIIQNRLHIEITNLTSVLDQPLEKLLLRGLGLSNTIARLQQLYGSQQLFAIRNLAQQGVVVSLSFATRLLPFQAKELEIYEHSSAHH